MKKVYILLYIFVMLILSSFVASAPAIKDVTISAGQLTLSTNIPEAIPQNTLREFEIHILNTTNFIYSNINCSLHIYDEDNEGGHLFANDSWTLSKGIDIEFKVPANIHEKKGIYSYKTFCNTTNNQVGLYERAYYVTKSGNPPAEDNFTIFIYLLFVIAIVGLFYTLFTTLAKLVTASETIYGVLTTWSFFILMILVKYIAEEYLLRTFVEDLASSFITITTWTNILLPIIGFIITMFIKSTQKKKPIDINELGGFR